VAGVAQVVREAYPDPTQFDPKSRYHDPKSTRDEPRWVVVDLKPVKGFETLVSLPDLRASPLLADMGVLRRGNRLSVQAVSGAEFREVLRMGARKSSGSKKSV
jgi:predicted RNA-binding protein with PUA-like domain